PAGPRRRTRRYCRIRPHACRARPVRRAPDRPWRRHRERSRRPPRGRGRIRRTWWLCSSGGSVFLLSWCCGLLWMDSVGQCETGRGDGVGQRLAFDGCAVDGDRAAVQVDGDVGDPGQGADLVADLVDAAAAGHAGDGRGGGAHRVLSFSVTDGPSNFILTIPP